jgi:hypothetical protein
MTALNCVQVTPGRFDEREAATTTIDAATRYEQCAGGIMQHGQWPSGGAQLTIIPCTVRCVYGGTRTPLSSMGGRNIEHGTAEVQFEDGSIMRGQYEWDSDGRHGEDIFGLTV